MIYLGTVLTLILSALFLYYKGNQKLNSDQKVSLLSFFAILFTTGLDGGLLLLPLIDFANYTTPGLHTSYQFTNPLAIEFGFWACLSWLCYFVTTCYFALYEKQLNVFQIPWVKTLNCTLIMLTCAFSAWLLLSSLNFFIPQAWLNHFPYLKEATVFLVILLAVISSIKILYIKWLSVFSLVIFLLLAVFVANESHLSISTFIDHSFLLNDYFLNLNQFVFPLDVYHQFYMYWWVSWSIIIGQFTAQFVNGLRVYQVFLAILVLPSIPIAIWFIVLFDAFSLGLNLSINLKILIAFLGALFVVNSMDSMIKLYSSELSLTRHQLGSKQYLFYHLGLLSLLTMLYEIKMLDIELVGSIVIILWMLTLYFWLKTKLVVKRGVN